MGGWLDFDKWGLFGAPTSIIVATSIRVTLSVTETDIIADLSLTPGDQTSFNPSLQCQVCPSIRWCVDAEGLLLIRSCGKASYGTRQCLSVAISASMPVSLQKSAAMPVSVESASMPVGGGSVAVAVGVDLLERTREL